jgi:hypothetical protein
MEKFKSFALVAGPVALAIAIVAVILALPSVYEPAVERANTLIYFEQGGSKQVVSSGGEIELLSGSTLDVQSGATFSAGADMDVAGEIEVQSGGEIELLSGSTLDVQSGANFNIGSLYPLLFASSGQQAIYGTSSITGTATAEHGLTTVTFALCTLGEDPETGAGDAALCTVTVSSNTVTVKAWQDDFSAATEADVVIHWLVFGVP